jgi:thiol-disulfide isomerase/thioredoxin
MAKPPPSRQRPAASPRQDQTRTLLMIAGVVAVVAVVAVIVAVVVGGGGGDDGGDDAFFRAVEVDGEPLPVLAPEIRRGEVADPAVGTAAPVVSGTDYAGNPISIDAAADGPTLVVLMAHWCPHCNAEIPRLNEWRDGGGVPDGLNVIGISTGVSSAAPNYPPDEWLQDMDWQWPVLADDRQPDDETPPPAMEAYGGASYPTMVVLGSDGRVLARAAGELSVDDIDSLVDEALANDNA